MVPDEFTEVIEPHDVEPADEAEAAQKAKNEAAIRLLDALAEGDAQEQQETWEYLKRVLDEDRLSSRKLFP